MAQTFDINIEPEKEIKQNNDGKIDDDVCTSADSNKFRHFACNFRLNNAKNRTDENHHPKDKTDDRQISMFELQPNTA